MTSKLTYIASGCSHVRINLNNYLHEDVLSRNCQIMKKMQDVEGHNFGLLYNAWVESEYGKKFQVYKPVISELQADSGGLQILTQGKSITSAMKDSVYRNQAKWSDIAMSFDEIPVTVSAKPKNRLDLSTRWYDKDKVEDFARISGQNVARQIQIFDELNSNSKIMVIAQGNCLDSYQLWMDVLLKEIPKDRHERINGVAMGAAALGHGPLEDIKRAFYFNSLENIPKKQMHLLAVGAINRLLPNLIFKESGLYKNLHITYDSTTHTSGFIRGDWTNKDGRLCYLPKTFVKSIYEEAYLDMNELFGIESTLEDYYDSINLGLIKLREKYNLEKINELLVISFAHSMRSIYNFMKAVDKIRVSKETLLNHVKPKDKLAFSALYDIKDLDDFLSWERDFGKYVRSDPVMSEKPQSLESFFE